MFHRASGKVFFYIVTLMFFVLSLQNTWGFLNKTLPGAEPMFLLCMLIVFEGGFLGWLAMALHGAENVWRVGISFVMLLITGTGVFTGAYFEIGGMMHAGIGYKVDPAILAWVPTSVLVAYMATGAACVLYMMASPEFFWRMKHMNTTGQAPAIGSRMEMLPPTYITPENQIAPARSQQRALPAPKQAPRQQPMLVQGGSMRNRFGNWLAGKAAGLQGAPMDDASVEADEQAQTLLNELVDSSDDVHQNAQSSGAADEQEAVMSYSAAPQKRSAPARRKPAATTGKGTRRSAEDTQALLEMLDVQMPGKSVADLARMARVDESTVRRYRAAQKASVK